MLTTRLGAIARRRQLAMKRAWWMMASVALASLEPSDAFALDWQTLVMPGKVIQAHAKYERSCSKCHAPLSNVPQRTLCLDCHDVVGNDVSDKEGYHGLSPEIQRKPCASCHADHAGRNAAAFTLNQDTFAHDLTDFPLRAQHETVPCSSCHEPGAKHRAAPRSCVACHGNDSPHRKDLAGACSQCHGEASWHRIDFNHSETRFALEGKHIGTRCVSCHTGDRYRGAPTDCNSCHRLEDAHQGKFGTDCDSCHRATEWRTSAFDHDHRTTFPLTGKHRAVTCRDCHPGPLHQEKLKTTCVSCHRSDDEHFGHYGEECEKCHNPTNWTHVLFDHDKATKYPLRGAHKRLRCKDCHKGDLYEEKLATACRACHREDDVHGLTSRARCDRCHVDSGWRKAIQFDHDLTRLPLLGLHAAAPCEACHLTQRFHDAKHACFACHESQDAKAHRGRLGRQCGQCHNPNGWQLWDFDHDLRTSFPLDGAHADLQCETCHKRAVRGRPALTGACDSCHSVDDVHHGTFGTHCEQCHRTSSFAAKKTR